MMIYYLGMGKFLSRSEKKRTISDQVMWRFLSQRFTRSFRDIKNKEMMFSYALNNFDLLMYWGLWETASFFVTASLKTSFGPPLITLQGLEKTISSYLDIIKCLSVRPDEFIDIFDTMSRLKYILVFLNFLKMQIQHAAKGCSELIQPVPPTCTKFFSSNLKVCIDFFQGLQPKLCFAASLVGEIGLILSQEQSQLSRHLSGKIVGTTASKFLKSLCTLQNIFIEEGNADEVLGLGRILESDQEIRGCLSKYLYASAMECAGRLETALKLYDDIQNIGDEKFLEIQINEKKLGILSVMQDWKGFDEVISTLKDGDSRDTYTYALKFRKLCGPSSKRTSLNEYLAKIPELLSSFALGENINFGFSKSGISSCLLRWGLLRTIRNLSLDAMDVSATSIQTKKLRVLQKLFTLSYDDLRPNMCALVELQSATQNFPLIQSYKNGRFQGLTDFVVESGDLAIWSRVLSLRKIFKPVDSHYGDICYSISVTARYGNNLQIAKNALQEMHAEAKSSLSICQKFGQALILLEEKKFLEGYSSLFDLIQLHHNPRSDLDLKVQAKSCIIFAGVDLMDIPGFNPSPLYDKICNYFEGLNMHGANVNNREIMLAFSREATRIAPSYSTTWYSLGTYGYRHSRSMIQDLRTGGKRYFNREMMELDILLQNQYTAAQSEIIKSLLDFVLHGSQDFSFWKSRIPSELAQNVISILTKISDQIKAHLETSIGSYFKFLEVSQEHSILPENVCSLLTYQSGTSATVTTTLRLLRLFAKHGIYLRDVFRECFATSSVKYWTAIVPQLISRIFHPDSFVREEIKKVLLRIGESNPQSLAYLAVVGGLESDSQEVHDFFSQISQIIRMKKPEMIIALKTWVMEIRRIAVLLPEKVSFGLEQIVTDLQNRLVKIKGSYKRISGNASLAEGEKRTLSWDTMINILKPVSFNFDSLINDCLENPPETPVEKEFHHIFLERLLEIQKLLQSINSIENAELLETELILLLKAIHSRDESLRLNEISPILADFPENCISIPGFDEMSNVTVTSCVSIVTVLQSKTKPKKLILIGSDGLKYPFLVKGQEDLHLDERIQQFLIIANMMLNSNQKIGKRELKASTFNVVPLGNNFGMIQWVENTSSLFSIYKKVQEFEFNAYLTLKKDSTMRKRFPTPQEYFHAKLRTASEKKLINLQDSRDSWPKNILQEIYQELKRETANDYILNHLWTSSTSTYAWIQKTRLFSDSTAVMSMIGYVLGLGDRHLENMLLHTTGELVHIDFNICFEKGKALKIPEVVPFRLTQNIVAAIGNISMSGSFKVSCERVLSTLRENSEIFLTLFESFIYDPIVDWTKNTHTERQLLTLNMNIGLLKSRIGEVKPTLEDGLLVFPVLVSTFIHACDDHSLLSSKGKAIIASRNVFETEQANDIISISRLKQKMKNLASDLQKDFQLMSEKSTIFDSYRKNILNLFHGIFRDNSTREIPTDIVLPAVRSIVVLKNRVFAEIEQTSSSYAIFAEKCRSKYRCTHFPSVVAANLHEKNLVKLRNSLNAEMELLFRTQPVYIGHLSRLEKVADAAEKGAMELSNFSELSRMREKLVDITLIDWDKPVTLAAIAYLIPLLNVSDETSFNSILPKVEGLHEFDLYLERCGYDQKSQFELKRTSFSFWILYQTMIFFLYRNQLSSMDLITEKFAPTSSLWTKEERVRDLLRTTLIPAIFRFAWMVSDVDYDIILEGEIDINEILEADKSAAALQERADRFVETLLLKLLDRCYQYGSELYFAIKSILHELGDGNLEIFLIAFVVSMLIDSKRLKKTSGLSEIDPTCEFANAFEEFVFFNPNEFLMSKKAFQVFSMHYFGGSVRQLDKMMECCLSAVKKDLGYSNNQTIGLDACAQLLKSRYSLSEDQIFLTAQSILKFAILDFCDLREYQLTMQKERLKSRHEMRRRSSDNYRYLHAPSILESSKSASTLEMRSEVFLIKRLKFQCRNLLTGWSQLCPSMNNFCLQCEAEEFPF